MISPFSTLDQARATAFPTSSARPLRVLALVPKPVGVSPGQRYRLEQWAPHAERCHGVRVDFAPFESEALTHVLYEPGRQAQKAALVAKDFVRRLSAVISARHYDGAIVYREAALVGPAIYERLLHYMGVPFIFDFDDAIWREAEAEGANGAWARLHFWGKTATNCRLAAGVLVGNGYLAGYARQHNPNVTILPTSIELAQYPVQPEAPQDAPFTICWTGSSSTLAHFEYARPALERLAARRTVTVKVICSRLPDRPIAGAENVFVSWKPETEAEDVGACHVGIMPLPDTDYTRGKCGLKGLQYMATGRPAVMSPVGMNRDLVRHGENGFLPDTEDCWVATLERLADDPDLRARVGHSGRKTVEVGYSGEAVGAAFAQAIRRALEPPSI